MMKDEILINLFGQKRLNSYKLTKNEDSSIILSRYFYNIELSEALYPILSILEVSLRNRIYKAIEFVIEPDWLIKELQKQRVLLNKEHQKLVEAYGKLIKKKYTNICSDDLIAELSLGFWVNLCTKKYKTSLWHREGFFRIVFQDYPNFSEFDKLSKIFPILNLFLKLRNRVFHHEIIINHPYGIDNCYNDLRVLLSYISKDSLSALNKICKFNKIYRKQKPQ